MPRSSYEVRKAEGEAHSILKVRVREPVYAAPSRWGEWSTTQIGDESVEIAAQVLGNGGRNPRLLLAAVTQGGDRYDVSNFTVTVTYVGFAD